MGNDTSLRMSQLNGSYPYILISWLQAVLSQWFPNKQIRKETNSCDLQVSASLVSWEGLLRCQEWAGPERQEVEGKRWGNKDALWEAPSLYSSSVDTWNSTLECFLQVKAFSSPLTHSFVYEYLDALNYVSFLDWLLEPWALCSGSLTPLASPLIFSIP